MKISEQRDSAVASMMQAKGINKQRKKKDAAAPVAKKKMTLPSLSTSALFDSLESYDQVISCASKGKLHFCSVPDLHCVLKVNGFQYFHHRKDYIEKNFSILSRVLFQTRFSSLIMGDTVITAVALEDSEVVQDLEALQWLDGASKGLVLSSPEEGPSLGERQPDCVSEVHLDGLSDDLVESTAAISSLKTFQPAHISSHPVEGATDVVELSADDCYRPDMSMIVMHESIQARSGPSMCSSDQRGVLCSQEEIQLLNGSVSQPEAGGPLTHPSMPLFCFEEQPLQPSPVSSMGPVEEPTQPPFLDSDRSAIASQEIRQAEVKSESEEEFDLVEKFAMEALELNVLHGLFEEDDLSDIELLDEPASTGSMQVVANVHDFVELEEDQSSNSCQIQEVQVNSPLCVVPSPQQTSSAEGNSVGFLGLLDQVSIGHSNALNYSNCNLEEQRAMFNTEARRCAKRLFMDNEDEGSVEGEAARLPRRKTEKLDHSVALEA